MSIEGQKTRNEAAQRGKEAPGINRGWKLEVKSQESERNQGTSLTLGDLVAGL